MDFDNAKENIQPLAAGRNLRFLHAALNSQSRQEILEQRRALEAAIENYEGDDPIAPWFDYILWIEQSYPSGGKEAGLDEVLTKCLQMFENDQKYCQDRRLIKLYIKFIDSHENPQECYQELYNQGIGTMVADLYICWAYYYELTNNAQKADAIFRKGLEARAQPYEDLDHAYKSFGFAVSQRILHNDEASQQTFLTSLHEKRQALTSLRANRRKVGSIRTGAAVKSYEPGMIKVENTKNEFGNVPVSVYMDENEDLNNLPKPSTSGESKSVIHSIIDSALKQENLREPGPWSKAQKDQTDQKKSVFATGHHQLAFDILEDANSDIEKVVISEANEKLSEGIQLPIGFAKTNKPQEDWRLAVTLEEDAAARTLPKYNKCYCYPRTNLEFAPEEVRAYKWFAKRNIENDFVKRRLSVWSNSATTGLRMYPNFRKANLPQSEFKTERVIEDPANASCKTSFSFDVKAVYPEDSQEEFQLEEILWRKIKDAGRKTKFSANETIAIEAEMEETICETFGSRRKSFFPPRKSISPLVAHHRDSEDEEEEAETNRTPPAVAQANSAESEDFQFKTPSVPAPAAVPKSKVAFQIYEEEEESPNFEANETCSTQMFNCFIKSQSVSTPKGAKTVSFFSKPPALAAVPVIAPLQALSPPEYNEGPTLHGKQLSTIMETSEPIISSTGSTKSSVDTCISSAEFDSDQSKLKGFSVFQDRSTVRQLSEELNVQNDLQKEQPLYFEASSPSPVESNNKSLFKQSLLIPESPSPPQVNPQVSISKTRDHELSVNTRNVSTLAAMTEEIPYFAPCKYFEDKTETIPKMMLAKKAEKSLCLMESKVEPQLAFIKPFNATDDEMLDFFTKSPVKGNISFASTKPPEPKQIELPKAERSIMSASSFFNFNDDVPATKSIPNDPKQTELPKVERSIMSASSFFNFNDDVPAAKSILASSKPTEPKQTELPKAERSIMSASSFFNFNDDVPAAKSVKEPSQAKNNSIVNASSFFGLDDDEVKVKQPTVAKNKSIFGASNYFQFSDDDEPKNKSSERGHLSFLRPKEDQSQEVKEDVNKSKNLSFIPRVEEAPLAKNESITKSNDLSMKKPTAESAPKKSISCFDASLRPEDFFEDNFGTDAFALNISSIRNSTLLPNHAQQKRSMKLMGAIEETSVSVKQPAELSRNLMPPPSLPPPAVKRTASPTLPEFSYDDDNELGRSIYFVKTPETPKMARHDNKWTDKEDSGAVEFLHRAVDMDQTRDVIETNTVGNVNPFDSELISAFLDQIDFSNYIDRLPNCELIGKVVQMRSGHVVSINDKKFECLKLIGEGSYGSVYLCKDLENGELVALKQEKPANMYEFYICLEVACRLSNNPEVLPGFMKVDYALMGNNASVLVSKYTPYGSLIAVCNQIKKVTMKNVDEYVVMHLASQLLTIMDNLHASNIIHADVKADNFLLMSKLIYGEKTPAVQLIDFGVSIDMELHKEGQTFTFIHSCDEFNCIEMKENRPWTYQIDLYGLAGVIHVLLFGKYMDVVKKPTGWAPSIHIPRYFHKTIWTSIFHTLLNVKDCQSMPNLQSLKAILTEEMFNKERYVRDKIHEFNKALN